MAMFQPGGSSRPPSPEGLRGGVRAQLVLELVRELRGVVRASAPVLWLATLACPLARASRDLPPRDPGLPGRGGSFQLALVVAVGARGELGDPEGGPLGSSGAPSSHLGPYARRSLAGTLRGSFRLRFLVLVAGMLWPAPASPARRPPGGV